ncbi:MAG: septal ring lytic transglycosylase RlpA family protein [Gammaproteobacteria bacterium]|nr:septal ring lytic transglycosylase RlpA family protein [Gammaproteobacteria bacterium]
MLRYILYSSIFLFSGCDNNLLENQDFNPKSIQKVKIKKEKISVRGKRSYRLFGNYFEVEKYRDDYHQKGYASWYVGNNKDSVTAINEVYDPNLLTAAHKSLPLPCYAKVTNLDNGRSIIVRINDRGPYISNRIIDLSYAAAYELGMLKKGLALVQIDTLNHGDDIKIPMTSIKYGPFQKRTIGNRIEKKFKDKTTLISKNGNYFVVVGPFNSQIKLDRARVYLRHLNQYDAKLKTLRSKNIKKV